MLWRLCNKAGWALVLLAAPAAARESLGVFAGWGAFRDLKPLRCFAVAEPVNRTGGSGWRPYAAIAHWPGYGLRGQVQVRMSRARQPGAPVTLTVGARRFTLVAGGADAWAPDPASDAAIVAALRGGTSFSVESRDRAGRGFADAYRLRGAASAVDAAALGCARP
jgi:hypothetical protein